MSRGRCGHGQQPGNGKAITVSGSRERKADDHERTCRGAVLFNHEGFLGRVVCCATCGRRVA